MKSFFELRESAKQLSEKTMELAGVTLQNMEHCPGAVSAFKENLKNGASEADVAKAAKAVDAYLAIEDKAKTSGATEDDLEEMEDLVDKAKKIIDELGLEGHTYHDMHLERVEDMIDDDDDDEDEMNEAVEDDMPASPDEKSMALDQAKFLQYVGKEVTQYLEKNKEFPEWMQNKLSGLHEKAKDMHAVLAGDYENDKSMDEAMTASQHRMAMLDKIKKSGVVKTGSMSKNEAMKKPSDKELNKTLAMTKNKEQGIAALMKKHNMDKGTARAHMKRLMGEEAIDEVLDTPQAMQSYRNKAKASKEKAAKSATAAVLRSKDKETRAHPAKDLKTIAKRTAGERMADKAAMRKTFNKLRGNK